MRSRERSSTKEGGIALEIDDNEQAKLSSAQQTIRLGVPPAGISRALTKVKCDLVPLVMESVLVLVLCCVGHLVKDY